MEERAKLKQVWEEAGQGHVFAWESSLGEQERQDLYEQVKAIDVLDVNARYQNLTEQPQSENAPPQISPIVTYKLHECSTEDRQKWRKLGYEALRDGTVAILLMAGGQGTRLGSSDPKGTYNVHLLSGKTLFQLHAERILKLQQLAAAGTGQESIPPIPWYIMLSEPVHQKTIQFFQEHNYFGLKEEQIIFFDQGEFPCITPQGKIILEGQGKIATAPNGNGGLWQALSSLGLLAKMKRSGIKWIASYIIDNFLAKVCDPVFLGFTIDKDLDVGSKVVPKVAASERVGVLALKNNRYTVLEYTEIDEEKRNAVNERGELVYNASHLVINNFKFSFVEKFCEDLVHSLPLHIASKIIPCIDEAGVTQSPEKPNGWKIELFAFDIFEHAKSLYALQTERSEEFSPLKNSSAAPTDNPHTCRLHLSNLCKKWIVQAGGTLKGEEDALCEISPLLTYEGEGLEALVKGKEITLPCYLV